MALPVNLAECTTGRNDKELGQCLQYLSFLLGELPESWVSVLGSSVLLLLATMLSHKNSRFCSYAVYGASEIPIFFYLLSSFLYFNTFSRRNTRGKKERKKMKEKKDR